MAQNKDFKGLAVMQILSQTGETEEENVQKSALNEKQSERSIATKQQQETTESYSIPEPASLEDVKKLLANVKLPKGLNLADIVVETKSARMLLALQPSLLAALKTKAKQQGISVNQFCHQALERAVQE